MDRPALLDAPLDQFSRTLGSTLPSFPAGEEVRMLSKVHSIPRNIACSRHGSHILPACSAPPPNSRQSAKGGVDGTLPINRSYYCSIVT